MHANAIHVHIIQCMQHTRAEANSVSLAGFTFHDPLAAAKHHRLIRSGGFNQHQLLFLSQPIKEAGNLVTSNKSRKNM